jgi:hypothetical protein
MELTLGYGLRIRLSVGFWWVFLAFGICRAVWEDYQRGGKTEELLITLLGPRLLCHCPTFPEARVSGWRWGW